MQGWTSCKILSNIIGCVELLVHLTLSARLSAYTGFVADNLYEVVWLRVPARHV